MLRGLQKDASLSIASQYTLLSVLVLVYVAHCCVWRTSNRCTNKVIFQKSSGHTEYQISLYEKWLHQIVDCHRMYWCNCQHMWTSVQFKNVFSLPHQNSLNICNVQMWKFLPPFHTMLLLIYIYVYILQLHRNHALILNFLFWTLQKYLCNDNFYQGSPS